ncbi:hypothetical protein R1sor_009436 [Riccia sorocarpa]|uniref:Uncharacterized protein n=1 Tax=Riccia sorocarpa TaxID=122646 RepID=A0ABD3HZ39_9MARC
MGDPYRYEEQQGEEDSTGMDVDANQKRGRENHSIDLTRGHNFCLIGSPSTMLTTSAKRPAFTVQHTVEVIEAGSNRRLSFARRTIEGGAVPGIESWALDGYQHMIDPTNPHSHNGFLLLQDAAGAGAQVDEHENVVDPTLGQQPHTESNGARTTTRVGAEHGSSSQQAPKSSSRMAWAAPGRIQSLHGKTMRDQEEDLEEDLKQRAGNPYLDKITPEIGDKVIEEEIAQAFEAFTNRFVVVVETDGPAAPL